MCEHREVDCINHFELVRKYRCRACGAVMMCACDAKVGRRFLSHQLHQAVELETQGRVPVTDGFQAGICSECRGLIPEAHPKAATHGRTSKVKRFYWRELAFRKMELLGEWEDAHGVLLAEASSEDAAAAREQAESQAIEEIKALHARSPKYSFEEDSQSKVIEECNIKVITLDGTYLKCDERGHAQLLDGGDAVSVEELAGRHFKKQGYAILRTESRPFHVLFGVYMWPLIQDPRDPLVRIAMFGDRTVSEAGLPARLISTNLPTDFGKPGYAERRAHEIDEHLRANMGEQGQLVWLFDYWLEPSEGLRQYLWAHRDADVEAARQLVRILPADVVTRILRYLVGDYWGRYTGWPDMIAYRADDFIFIEAKSSGDTLSEDQKKWIRGNSETLGLPFKIVKVRKKAVLDADRAAA